MRPAEGESGGNFGPRPPSCPPYGSSPGGPFPHWRTRGAGHLAGLAPSTAHGALHRRLALNVALGGPTGAPPGPTGPPEPMPRHLGRQWQWGRPVAKPARFEGSPEALPAGGSWGTWVMTRFMARIAKSKYLFNCVLCGSSSPALGAGWRFVRPPAGEPKVPLWRGAGELLGNFPGPGPKAQKSS